MLKIIFKLLFVLILLIAVPTLTNAFIQDTSTKTSNSLAASFKIPTATAPIRGMWVYGTASSIVLDTQTQNDFFNFINAPHGDNSMRINHLYFFGDGLHLDFDERAVRAFLRRAHDEGVAVEYLTGSASWALNNHDDDAIERVDKVLAFNAGSINIQEQFDGIHFDIEPYMIPEWKTQRVDMAKNYMEILQTSRAHITNSKQPLLLTIDIPTWLSVAVPEIWNPLMAANTPIDGATIMNYFDTSATFLYGYNGVNKAGGIGPNLAKSKKVKLTFGAETMKVDPTTITFHEEGFVALKKVFREAQKKYSHNKNFAGLAVHHYESYRALK